MNWNELLAREEQKPYFSLLLNRITDERMRDIVVYPPKDKVYRAFDCTPFDQVKVIILGQEPHLYVNQADGLAFSSTDKSTPTPTLQNIFQEIEQDLGVQCLPSGDLTRWARQGVLLLNTTLTARAKEPNSHAMFGWEFFTDVVIKELDRDNSPKVFLLFGKNTRRVKPMIVNPTHLVIEGIHPSPFSANRGFFGGRYFSQTNDFLTQHNLAPIDWR